MDPNQQSSPQSADDHSTTPTLIVLDAPGVLYDHTIWRRWLFQLLHRIGLSAEFDVFWQLWDEQYESQAAAGELPYWQALRKFLREVGMREGCIDEVVAAGLARRDDLETPLRPLNGAGRTLATLFGQGFSLVATGHRADSRRDLEWLLGRWGLRQYFRLIENSCSATCSGHVANWRAAHLPDLPQDSPIAFVSRRPSRVREAAMAGCLPILVGRAAPSAQTMIVADVDELPERLRSVNPTKQKVRHAI